MRRLLHVSLVCALLAVLPVSTALAADAHHRTTTTSTTSHVTRHHTSTSKSKAHHGKTPAHHMHGAHHASKGRHHHPIVSPPATGKATAAQGRAIINDCQSHGQLTHAYTHAELEKAKSMLTSYNKQYSNCATVIESALVHSSKLGGGGGGSSGSGTTIIIIVAVVLVVLAAALGGLALRRRRGPGGSAHAA